MFKKVLDRKCTETSAINRKRERERETMIGSIVKKAKECVNISYKHL